MLQSVWVKLCPCTGWKCAPADKRWNFSYSEGQTHGNGSRSELTAREGIKSPFQHWLPGSVRLKVLLRSNVGSRKSINSLQRIKKANKPCTVATGASKRLQGPLLRMSTQCHPRLFESFLHIKCVYIRTHTFFARMVNFIDTKVYLGFHYTYF